MRVVWVNVGLPRTVRWKGRVVAIERLVALDTRRRYFAKQLESSLRIRTSERSANALAR
jgi:hypothetical protein